jgi:hypothetical protein
MVVVFKGLPAVLGFDRSADTGSGNRRRGRTLAKFQFVLSRSLQRERKTRGIREGALVILVDFGFGQSLEDLGVLHGMSHEMDRFGGEN